MKYVPAEPLNLQPTTPKFKVGDTVVFINDAGINFGERTIIGVEHNHIRGTTYYIDPTDTPWFAHNERNLFRHY